MRDRIRSELLDALSQLSRIRPEWRLGQTVANLAMTAGRLDQGGVWDLEDDEALAAARTLLEQNAELECVDTEQGAAPDHGGITVSRSSTAASPPRQVS